MSQSPLDEFNQRDEEVNTPNEEPVHSIHRIFVFAATLVKRNALVVLPFMLIALIINISVEGYLKSVLLGMNIKVEDLIGLLQRGAGSDVAEKMNDLATQFILINLVSSTLVTLIYTNCAAYIASGNAGKGDGNFSRILGFMIMNFVSLTIIVIVRYFVIGLGITLFLIPGIMIYLYLLFAYFVFIFERKGVWECMTKSMELMNGVKMNFVTFISYAVLVFLPVWILNGISGGSMYLTSFFIEGDNTVFSMMNLILASISVVLREFIWLGYATGVCLLYLKRCKD